MSDPTDNRVDNEEDETSIPMRRNSRGQLRPRIYNVPTHSDSTAPLPDIAQNAPRGTMEENVPEVDEATLEMKTAEEAEPEVSETDHTGESETDQTGDMETDQIRNAETGQAGNGENEQAGDTRFVEDPGLFDFIDDSLNQPIYPGHTMSVFNSIMLVWIFALTHSITSSQLSDLLVLINAHCLIDVPVFASLKKFKNFFANLRSPIKKHYFCSFCLTNVDLTMKNCPNSFCDKLLTKKNATSFFIEFSVEQQIVKLFNREEFLVNLDKRFHRRKINDDGIEDIYDGHIYKTLSSPGNPLSKPYNISFTWNTDGIPVFKSSKYSIWPMYLLINELPYHIRKEKKNMIFYGLWFGELKPSINLFCKPLQDSLIKLETEGINITVNDKIENVKAFLLCGTADLPAKACALNMVQFNGFFACSRCLQRGRSEKTGPKTGQNTFVFPYNTDNPVGPPRTHEDALTHSLEALNTGNSIFGIKGPSFLSGLSSYNFCLSTSIDYMHCILLGVTKKLMTLWFSASNSAECFSLTKDLDFVDNCLTSIKPPYYISRRPRSVSEHLKFWKASEFRSWLFYYSVPILSKIMEPLYFFHFCAFVEAVWFLCQDSISKSDIEHSNALLNYFVCLLKPLYGERYMTLNAHLLLHLPKCVQDLGPLYVYSCFPFESVNGDLLKLFHGTQHVETQILSAVNNHQILPLLISKMSGNALECPILTKYVNKSRISLGLNIDHDVYVVGKKIACKFSKTIKDKLVAFLGHNPVSIIYYGRLKLRDAIIHSELYTRVTARNSFTVKYLDSHGWYKFGFVKVFAVHRLQECNCDLFCHCNNSIIAIVTELQAVQETVIDKGHQDFPQNLNLRVGHVHVLKEGEPTILNAVEIHQVVSLCVSLKIGNLNYVCEFPNTIECD